MVERPIALSRNEPSYETDADLVSADLLDGDAATDVLSDLDAVTHVFYAAYLPTKLHRYGFGEVVDSETAFHRVFDEYRKRDLLP